jgi:dethiobiotin synthetase
MSSRVQLDLFVTGTDTGVGKTWVTALLLEELRRRGVNAAGFKPIACGAGGRNDARLYRRIMNREVPLDVINPVCLRHSLAPSVAARLQRRRIDLRRIAGAFAFLRSRYDAVLVEGAGGLLVPIRDGYFVADLARDLQLPLLVIGRLGLGTINHTLLTVRQARQAGLTVRGIVLNDIAGGRRGLAERTNVRVVPALCRAPLLGVTPHEAAGGARVAAQICERLLNPAAR